MAAGNELESGTEDGVSESRQRLRPWIINKLNKQQIPGLMWLDQKEMVFKIPWKHGGKQDWVPQQGQIFMEWAKHTGKYREGIDTPTYAKWKTNLRCALNKAPDIKELADQSRKDEPNPYKVYKFLERKKKTIVTAKNSSEYTMPPDAGLLEIPTVVPDYSSNSGSFNQLNVGGIMGPTVATANESGERLPSDLYSVKSMDLMHMSGNSTLSITDAMPSQEGMDFDSTEETGQAEVASTSFSQTKSEVPSPHTITTSPYMSSQSVASSVFVPQINTHSSINVQMIQPQFKYTTAKIKDEHEAAGAYGTSIHPIPVQMQTFLPNRPHSCNPNKGCEMSIEILYRSHKMSQYHVEDEKGCRITHGVLPPERESEIPDVLQDVLFGVDAKSMAVIELPQWPHGICSEELIPSVNDLLKNMQRGLLLACSNGDINAIRLCKTSIYYSSILDEDTKKLVRHDSGIEKTKIFDIENEFKPVLENYKIKKGPRPSPDIYLFIGQKGSKQELNNQLIVVKVTSCLALQLLTEADDETLNSFHISDPTDYDNVTDCVLDQLSNNDTDSDTKYTDDSNMSMQE